MASVNALPSKPPSCLPSPSSPSRSALRRRLGSGSSPSSSSSRVRAPGSPPSPGGRTWHPLFTPTPSGPETAQRPSPFSSLLDWVSRSFPAPDPNRSAVSPCVGSGSATCPDSCSTPGPSAAPGRDSSTGTGSVTSSSSSSHGLVSDHDSSFCSGSCSGRANSLGPGLGPCSKHNNDSCADSCSSSRPDPGEVEDVRYGYRARQSPSTGSRSDPNFSPRHSSSVELDPRSKPYASTASSNARYAENPQGGRVGSSGSSSTIALAQPTTLCPGSSKIAVPSPGSSSSSNLKLGPSDLDYTGLRSGSRSSTSAGSDCVPIPSPSYSPCFALHTRPRRHLSSSPTPNHGSVDGTREAPGSTAGPTSAPSPSGTDVSAGLGPGPCSVALEETVSVIDSKSPRAFHPFFAVARSKRKRRAQEVVPPPLTTKAKRNRSGVYKPTRKARTLDRPKRKRGRCGRLGDSIEAYFHRTKRPRLSGINASLPVDREDATRADNNQFYES